MWKKQVSKVNMGLHRNTKVQKVTIVPSTTKKGKQSGTKLQSIFKHRRKYL